MCIHTYTYIYMKKHKFVSFGKNIKKWFSVQERDIESEWEKKIDYMLYILLSFGSCKCCTYSKVKLIRMKKGHHEIQLRHKQIFTDWHLIIRHQKYKEWTWLLWFPFDNSGTDVILKHSPIHILCLSLYHTFPGCCKIEQWVLTLILLGTSLHWERRKIYIIKA